MTKTLTDEKIIRKMFSINDTTSWDNLYQVFTLDILYSRPGQPLLRNIDSVVDYFKNQRPIESGTHKIHQIIAINDDTYHILGWFEGKLKNGSEFSTGFFDLIKLRNDEICLRKTYLDNQSDDDIRNELYSFIA